MWPPPALGSELWPWAPAWPQGWVPHGPAAWGESRVGLLHRRRPCVVLGVGPARSCAALQRWGQVRRCPAAPFAGAAWCCAHPAAPAVSGTALQCCLLLPRGPRQRVGALHGLAVLGASAAQPCSTIGEPCTALQHCLQVPHGPAARGANLARPRSAVRPSCIALQSEVRALRGPAALFAGPTRPCSTGCALGTALQRCLQLPHGPAAPGASLARPCGDVCRLCGAGSKPCTALQYRARAPCALAAPLAGPPGPCGVFRGTRSPHSTSCGSGPRCSTEHKSHAAPGPAAARGLLRPPQAPVPGPPGLGRGAGAGAGAGAGGKQVPAAAQLEGAGAARGTGTPAAAAGSLWDRGDAWGKSSVFNVPDSRLFLKQTDKFCCTALDLNS